MPFLLKKIPFVLGDIIWRGRPVFKDCDGTFCDITPLVRYFVMGHFGLDIFTDDTVCTYHCDATMGMFCDRTFCDWSFAILRYIMYSKYFVILLFGYNSKISVILSFYASTTVILKIKNQDKFLKD